MKILHVIQILRIGGIEKLVFSMVQEDPENVYVLAIEGSAEQSIKDWPMLAGIRDNLIFANKKEGFQKDVVSKIKKTCKQYSISVVHSHHIGPLLYSGLATLTMKNIRHVHTEHDVWHLNFWKARYIHYFLFKLNKKIRLVAVSQYVFDKLKFLFPKMEITLIPNAVDTERFQPGDREMARLHFNLPPLSILIGTAGRLEMVKGQSWLIEAMLKLPESYYLAIAGQGSLYNDYLTQIQTLGLSARVRLLGYTEETEKFYQACNIFCLPSLDEGLPLALLEAQSCNIPTVCSNVGGCFEGVDPDTGILVPSMDTDAIARACLSLEHRQGNPREFIIRNFSFEQLLKKYKVLYFHNQTPIVDKPC